MDKLVFEITIVNNRSGQDFYFQLLDLHLHESNCEAPERLCVEFSEAIAKRILKELQN